MMNNLAIALRALLLRKTTVTFDKVAFEFNHLSGKRLFTLISNGLANALRLNRVWTPPTILQIEPGNICNLRCPVCHVVTDRQSRGFMDFNHYKKLIDEVGERVFLIHFWGWGEPFMHPNVYDMIRYGKSRGLQFISSTNGHFFEQGDHADRLIESQLDVLIFALDGIDAATYEKYRHRGDFDRALRGLNKLLQRKKELGATLPRINLRMLVTRDNETQVEAMKALAQKLGVDCFTLKTMYSFDNEKDGRCLVPKKPEYRRMTYDKDGNPIRITNTCKKLWNHPVVYWDGEVVLCDYYNKNELTLGNVFQNGTSLTDVWYGAGMRRLRSRFRRGEIDDFRCGHCVMNYAGVDRCVSHIFQVKN
ncbi:radical SAM protein [candidate division KSB1 bacterium]|nr:radical SAM protein [candidate division KSB1 bacterium]